MEVVAAVAVVKIRDRRLTCIVDVVVVVVLLLLVGGAVALQIPLSLVNKVIDHSVPFSILTLERTRHTRHTRQSLVVLPGSSYYCPGSREICRHFSSLANW